MRYIKIIAVVIALLFSAAIYAKGHGGGHGGGGHHGGGGGQHSGSSHHSGGYSTSHSTAERSGWRTNGTRARKTTWNNGRMSNNATLNSGRHTRTVTLPGYDRNRLPATTIYENYAHGFSPYSGYGYSPFFSSAYSNLLGWGMAIGYTPNYGYAPLLNNSYGSSSYDNDNGDNGGIVNEAVEGYVVYAMDTLRGAVTLKPNAILLENTDSGHNYDYKFRVNQKQLAAVSVVNEDNKQLDLVRLNNSHKKLWRLIHSGKLNIYDGKHDFIYRPDDIDIRSLAVVYNGKLIRLDEPSPTEIKERLAGLVNSAYEAKLDPAKFSWNELLIYIDKLD